MKKRFFSMMLALMMCLALLPATALAAETVSETMIKIPGCNAIFTLENVSSEYVVVTEDNGLPEYRIALPGTTGKLTCDSAASITGDYIWEDGDPTQSGFGGGDSDLEPGWSWGYSERWLDLTGRGLESISLTIFDDGTLVPNNNAPIAYISFHFGYPVYFDAWDFQYPEDLISWRTTGWYQREVVDLPKYPISKLAVSSAAVKPKVVDSVEIAFTKSGHIYTMAFTNVADIVLTESENGVARPYTIFYYPGATVTVSEDMDNSADFTNGFFLETNYHFGEEGKVKAGTRYSIEDVHKKLLNSLPGADTDSGNSSTGTVGLGPVFLAPADWFGEDKNTASIYDFVVTDVPSTWAAEQVNSAIAEGLVPEILQKNYTQPVSRGNMAQMLINLIEKSSGQSIDEFLTAKGASTNSGAFTDTTDKAILAANALGILSGVGNDKFDLDGTLTRGQIVAIISRTARVLGVNTDGYTHNFTDVSGHWASAELGWPVYAGVITGVGDNKFDPDGKLTAEQAIAITYRAFDFLTDEPEAKAS